MIFFLHIPKTAGTTFYDVVKGNHDHFLKPKMEENIFDFLNSELYKKNTAIRLPGGYNTAPQVLNNIKKLSKDKIQNISFIGGHVGHGFHEEFSVNVQYISFVRNPLERIISDYKEHCKKGRFFYETLLKNNFDFNVYLKSVKKNNLDNIFTRQLAGPSDFFLREKILVNNDLFERALQNSKSVIFFEMENFNDALLFLKKNYKWKNHNYKIKNKSFQHNNIVMNQDLLNEVIYYDMELYNQIKIVNNPKKSWINTILNRN
jgi:hypothetical protein